MAKKGFTYSHRVVYRFPNGITGRIVAYSLDHAIIKAAPSLQRGATIDFVAVDPDTGKDTILHTVTPDDVDLSEAESTHDIALMLEQRLATNRRTEAMMDSSRYIYPDSTPAEASAASATQVDSLHAVVTEQNGSALVEVVHTDPVTGVEAVIDRVFTEIKFEPATMTDKLTTRLAECGYRVTGMWHGNKAADVFQAGLSRMESESGTNGARPDAPAAQEHADGEVFDAPDDHWYSQDEGAPLGEMPIWHTEADRILRAAISQIGQMFLREQKRPVSQQEITMALGKLMAPLPHTVADADSVRA